MEHPEHLTSTTLLRQIAAFVNDEAKTIKATSPGGIFRQNFAREPKLYRNSNLPAHFAVW